LVTNDDQRRPIGRQGEEVGRKYLADIATIVTPETLLAWHRKPIALKYEVVESVVRVDRCAASGIETLVQHLPAAMFEYQEHKQNSKTDRRNGEEID